MKLTKQLLTFLLLIVLLVPVYAQQTKLDSLLSYLKTNPSDTSKVSTLNAVTKQYIGIGDYEKAISTSEESKKIAAKADFQKGLANAINNMGVAQMNMGDYDKALVNYKEALKIRESIHDLIGIGSSNNNIGLIYANLGDNKKALEFYEIALKMRLDNNDKMGASMSYNNIGNLYIGEGDYDKAIENHNIALKLREELKDKAGIAMSQNNIGLIYNDRGDYKMALQYQLKALATREEIGDKGGLSMSYNNIGLIYYKLDQLDQALKYHLKALEMNQITGNQHGEAMSYNNIAIIYDRQKIVDKALDYNLKSLAIREKIGDIQGMGMSYSNIGLIYLNEKKFDLSLEYSIKSMEAKIKSDDNIGLTISYINIANVYVNQYKFGQKSESNLQKAADYIQKSLDLSKKSGYKDGVMNAYFAFSEYAEAKKDFQQALYYHQQYTLAKDSLFTDESTQQMAEMNAKYETAKKDKELIEKDAKIHEQQAITEQQTLVRNAFIVGFILVLILASFIFRSYKNKQKANEIITEQKNEVEKKNEIIGKQKSIVEEKNKEITDSINYAKRIQDTMLPSKKILNDLLVDNFVFYQPKDIISGDFYWTTKKNDQLFIVAADCTGHGVPGALMSMIGISFMRQIINENNITDTAEILNKLHAMILDALNEDVNVRNSKDGMDMAILKLDSKTKEIQFSGAVRPLYKVNANGLEIIKGDRYSIGGVKTLEESFAKVTIQTQPGDSFYMFSDGFADQFGGDSGKKFMVKRLQDYLKEIYTTPFKEQETLLNKTFNGWKGDYEQVDDILVIGVRV